MSYVRGENHPAWRGDGAGYSAVHIWMNRNYPRIGRCEWCAKRGRTDYAMARRDAGRNRADWLELCRRCHCAFDGCSDEARQRRSAALSGRKHDRAQIEQRAATNRARNVNRNRRMREARADGQTLSGIAAAFGVSTRTVRRVTG